ncbi:MAG: hypothetical protein KDC94_11290 [Aequorivita sp.]|nr:hypothetical protein [Aequorivita sp.]
MLWMFKRAGNENNNIIGSQFWQQNNKPIELWSTTVIKEKFNYTQQSCKSWFGYRALGMETQ